MPDNDPSHSADPGRAPYDSRNLPVPVPQPRDVAQHSESWIGRALRTLFGWKPGSIRADLSDVLDAAPGISGFSPQESRMLKNILGLRERRVDDLMIPRADIISVQQDISLGELMKVFQGAGHSRLVAYDDTLDDPVGMVHIRDLLALMAERAAVAPTKSIRRKKPLPAGLDLKVIDLALPLSSAKLVREILFVPPSMRALDLLARMQATHIHLSLVVDEYGGTDGLVSIEDIVEQIVGEIADEHDLDELPQIVRQQDESFVADARTSIDDVISVIGPDFNVGEEGKAVDTLGGYLVTRAGRVPIRGELVPGPDLFEFEVLDADPRRIKSVRIYRLKDRRERPRDLRRRGEPDAAAPASSTGEQAASSTDAKS